jgi:CheY-like chemotaxis protein
VITNLVGNALKFTEQGHVTLRTSEIETPRGPLLKVSVTDTGIGIPLDKQATLFQAFTQADSSTTRRYGGTGLGLVISRRLTELMGGEVGFESEPGLGSTFWFTLPVAPATMFGRRVTPAAGPTVGATDTPSHLRHLTVAPTPPRAHAVAPARANSAARGPVSAPLHEAPPLHLRVLVAEDGEVNQLLLMHLLPSFGCHADLGRDGREAVALFEAHTYDIVLMDCHMPEMDGFEATAAMRAIERRRHSAVAVPIVALTASATADDRTQCLAAGMDDFLTKPFRPADLREVLARWTAPELDVLVGAS